MTNLRTIRLVFTIWPLVRSRELGQPYRLLVRLPTAFAVFPVFRSNTAFSQLSDRSNLTTPAAPKDSWRELYPFESNFHPIGGHRLHYLDEGPRDAPPLLMVHGNPTWSFYYRNLVRELSGSYRTIAVDHLGCGLSDKPAAWDYCLENHIGNLVSLVESLGLEGATLIAHDWGGAIGMGTLQRLRKRFQQIVLFNTATFPPPYIPFRIRVCRWPLVGKLGLQGMNLFARAAITMATERGDGLEPTVAEGLLAPYDSWANRIATYKFVKDIPLSPSHRTWSVLQEIESGLDELKSMPIKLIWGMKDWCFRPECLERLKTHWPEADVTEFPQGGHYIVEDEPEAVVSLVQDFLGAT